MVIPKLRGLIGVSIGRPSWSQCPGREIGGAVAVFLPPSVALEGAGLSGSCCLFHRLADRGRFVAAEFP